MPRLQRYVSDELTHFVGNHHKEYPDRQYDILKQILKDGVITRDPPISPGGKATPALPVFFGVDWNVMEHPLRGTYSCFCDIPPQDFGIHMSRYGVFGLAFKKSFLITRGANPVFYVCKKSIEGSWSKECMQEVFKNAVTNFKGLEDLLEKKRLEPDVQEKLDALHNFLWEHFWAYVKPFEQADDEQAPENLYMEREWRILGGMKFEISDVCRIILPKEYCPQFRRDFNEYCGQVTFSDCS